MGNKPKPDPDHQVTPDTILEDEGGGGGVVVVDVELPSWIIVLEDVTPAAERLRPDTAVRGERAEPRFRVHAGRHLIGFVPLPESAEIRSAMEGGATGLLGRVMSVSTGRVVVRLRLEGR